MGPLTGHGIENYAASLLYREQNSYETHLLLVGANNRGRHTALATEHIDLIRKARLSQRNSDNFMNSHLETF